MNHSEADKLQTSTIDISNSLKKNKISQKLLNAHSTYGKSRVPSCASLKPHQISSNLHGFLFTFQHIVLLFKMFYNFSTFPKLSISNHIIKHILFKQNYSTRYSQVVSHLSTKRARTRLTSEIERGPVYSSLYGHS